MKKKKVNKHYIGLLLSYFYEGIDEELDQYQGLNLVNRESVTMLVKSYLLNKYNDFSISDQFRIKESLRYGINFWSEKELYDQFPMTNSFFKIPSKMTARELYKQIWDDLFFEEDVCIKDASNYEEIEDRQVHPGLC